ncbi:MAG: EamA family transporter RarD [Actinobacteria bacterium]|jgi:chloramphenicol-sensitive protein RarD|nr:EamA family transporter RarD [Actinomycetota bacterium]
MSGSGIAYAFGAYALWGLFPLYFLSIRDTNPFEIVSYRIIFSLLFCALVIAAIRKWGRFAEIFRSKRTIVMLGLASAVIYLNWQIFVAAVVAGHVVESSLGYFMNPILTVILGVVVLRERLRPLQWVAVSISFIAVLVLTFGGSGVPWVSLGLAITFGLYGLIKKRVGRNVDPLSGLMIESMWMTPIAVAQWLVVSSMVGVTAFTHGVPYALWIMAAGPITAIPLMMFAAATRRIPLTAIGLIQYSTPIFSFVFGVFVLKEPMPQARWAGFFIVWISLVILVVDMLRHAKRSRTARAAELI